MISALQVGVIAREATIMEKKWTAFQARLLRGVGVDEIEEIDYSQHAFTRYVHVVSGPGTKQPMDRNALNQLARELQAEIANPPAGVDVPGLEAMLCLIRASLPRNTQNQPAEVGAKPRGEA